MPRGVRDQARAGARTATSSCCAPPRRRAPTTRSPATATAVRRRAARGSPSDQGRQGVTQRPGWEALPHLPATGAVPGRALGVRRPAREKERKERKKEARKHRKPSSRRAAIGVCGDLLDRADMPRQERHARRPVCVRRVRHAERQQLRARRLRGLELGLALASSALKRAPARACLPPHYD